MNKIEPIIKGRILTRDDLKPLTEVKQSQSELFCIEIELQIGPKDTEGTDAFWMTICSPSWLSEEIAKNGKPIALHAHLVCKNFDRETIENRLAALVSSCSGVTWQDACTRLSRYFEWEFA